ncbi:hypothetical protein GCM10022289_24640 [Pedobacter jeongneungensis]|uniref:Uncharacterized protein n=1 Tax=Pedobacter jeongneungensis TaxID=947309 RepID=A0ABP8BFA5_9SPHI
MEELIRQLKTFLGNSARAIKVKGPAEIDIVVNENENIEALLARLQAHIIEIVDENTLGKINLVSPDGELKESFSLNQ